MISAASGRSIAFSVAERRISVHASEERSTPLATSSSTTGPQVRLSIVFICASTVFLKQHSVLDIPPALLLSAIGYVVVYRRPPARSASFERT